MKRSCKVCRGHEPSRFRLLRKHKECTGRFLKTYLSLKYLEVQGVKGECQRMDLLQFQISRGIEQGVCKWTYFKVPKLRRKNASEGQGVSLAGEASKGKPLKIR
jgi:hypothetical protein